MNIIQNILIVPPKTQGNPENTNITLLTPVTFINEEQEICRSTDHPGDNEVIS